MKRGEIYWVDFSPVVGSEQGGIRPAVILQNDMGNRHAPTTIVAPMTTAITKHNLPTHVRLDSTPHHSICLLEQVRTVDKSRVKELMGEVTPQELRLIDKALKISLGL